MKNIEIPQGSERARRYRLFEMFPGLLSWSTLLFPVVLSFFNPRLTVFLIIAFLLLWFTKALGLNVRAVQGWRTLEKHQKLPWSQMLAELASGKPGQPDRHIPTWHYENIRRLQETPTPIEADDIVHAVIIAAYNESREVLEPTIKSVIASDYDMSNVILVMAYEGHDGAQSEQACLDLVKQYGDEFRYATAVKHTIAPGEVRGKGSNITHAGRQLQKYIEQEGIDPLSVIVTTLDADNRPHTKYFAALSYVYAASPDPLHVSYQPVPMYTNNIWDAPAPMRVIATGNTFWNVVLSLRTHMIRNFSSHAQSLQSLIDTDFWSTRTIVEDGHQFWRTYFRYDGNHQVYPIYLPIYQDAVLSSNYRKTIKAQFVQLRRWAWGSSDIAYVAEKGFFTPNKVPKADLVMKFLRLVEGHWSWATAPILLTFSAFIPALLNPSGLQIGDDYAAIKLPLIASRIQTLALLGILVTFYVSLKTLPPKPARYKRHRSVFMVLQWVLLPVTTLVFNCLAGLNAQTRLLFGRYLDKFDVTDKAVVTDDNKRVM